ncbi:hypothetical protein [Parafrankia sp. BMG5.11]|nr:hypothetical protein [Parafrankia sp. BMG5.11]ABW12510.1 hypothetical protein Franean1_3098 [Frankia sp. EAN1pec]
MAALVCYRPGQRPRLFYRVLTHHGRKGERRSFSEAEGRHDDGVADLTGAGWPP